MSFVSQRTVAKVPWWRPKVLSGAAGAAGTNRVAGPGPFSLPPPAPTRVREPMTVTATLDTAGQVIDLADGRRVGLRLMTPDDATALVVAVNYEDPIDLRRRF